MRWYRLLALVPAAALIGAPWLADRLEPRLAGMPFFLAWIVGWVVLASAVMGVIGWLDARTDTRSTSQGEARRTSHAP